jgi:hypothetical protein
MTNEEMKTIYANAGVAEADIEKIQEKYDFDKINEIIETAHNPKEALERINAFYPELEVSQMQEQMDFIHSQIEAASHGEKTEVSIELTEDELDNVVGGWWGGTWRKVALTAVTVVVCAAVGVIAGGLIGCAAGPAGAIAGAIIGGGAAGYFGGKWAWDLLKKVPEDSK